MLNLPTTTHKKPRPAYRKPEAVRELEALAMDEARRLHPGNPALCPRTFRDDKAGPLTVCITSYLRLKGAFCSRLNNTGIYDKRLNRYRPGTNRKGLPDVIATHPATGKSLFIECKTKSDRMSEHQERIRDEQTASGGLYFVAHDFTSFKEWFDSL